jgi:hypothetical protein
LGADYVVVDAARDGLVAESPGPGVSSGAEPRLERRFRNDRFVVFSVQSPETSAAAAGILWP